MLLFFVLTVTFLPHRPTSSTGGRGSCGMTTTNKGNKALKVIGMYESTFNLSKRNKAHQCVDNVPSCFYCCYKHSLKMSLLGMRQCEISCHDYRGQNNCNSRYYSDNHQNVLKTLQTYRTPVTLHSGDTLGLLSWLQAYPDSGLLQQWKFTSVFNLNPQ